MTTGALLLADVALTLLWQEPLSALSAARSQHTLEHELRAETEHFARATAAPDARPSPAAAARAFASRLREGRAIGRIAMPTLGASYVMVEGTDPAPLRKGPGHYPDSGLPGMRRTVAIAGHRTTYLAPFAHIDRLKPGQPIVLSMPYGRFTYRVESTRIVDPDATWVTRGGPDRLVLTSCHPPLSAAHRIVVFARLAAGGG